MIVKTLFVIEHENGKRIAEEETYARAVRRAENWLIIHDQISSIVIHGHQVKRRVTRAEAVRSLNNRVKSFQTIR